MKTPCQLKERTSVLFSNGVPIQTSLPTSLVNFGESLILKDDMPSSLPYLSRFVTSSLAVVSTIFSHDRALMIKKNTEHVQIKTASSIECFAVVHILSVERVLVLLGSALQTNSVNRNEEAGRG